jgi:hypothetical protein
MAEDKKKKLPAQTPRGEEDDDIDLRIEKPRAAALDSPGSTFDLDAKKQWGGINSGRSVFDRGALFRTGKKETP